MVNMLKKDDIIIQIDPIIGFSQKAKHLQDISNAIVDIRDNHPMLIDRLSTALVSW